jgi:hypothetical protein
LDCFQATGDLDFAELAAPEFVVVVVAADVFVVGPIVVVGEPVVMVTGPFAAVCGPFAVVVVVVMVTTTM